MKQSDSFASRRRAFNTGRIAAVEACAAIAESAMDWTKFIDVTPGVRGGKPCLVGTRITPTDVLGISRRRDDRG
jgi:hypothetical protein